MPVRATVRVVFNDLPKLPAAIQTQAVAQVARSSFEIEANAKALCPVRTGTLRRSIHTVFLNNGLTGIVGPSVFYAFYVEFGTRFMAARPYMRPAAARAVPGFAAGLAALLKGLH